MKIILKLNGESHIIKKAKPFSNSAHVTVTNTWTENTVQIALIDEIIDDSTFLISGTDVKEVKKFSKSGNYHTIVPRSWVGSDVLVVKLE